VSRLLVAVWLAGILVILGMSGMDTGFESGLADSVGFAGGAPAVAIDMTGWEFHSGGINFVLIEGNFAEPASGRMRVEDSIGPTYLYSNSFVGKTVIGPVRIADLIDGHTYQAQVRAWTGSTGWGDLPWVDVGVSFVQPNRLDPLEEQIEA